MIWPDAPEHKSFGLSQKQQAGPSPAFAERQCLYAGAFAVAGHLTTLFGNLTHVNGKLMDNTMALI